MEAELENNESKENKNLELTKFDISYAASVDALKDKLSDSIKGELKNLPKASNLEREPTDQELKTQSKSLKRGALLAVSGELKELSDKAADKAFNQVENEKVKNLGGLLVKYGAAKLIKDALTSNTSYSDVKSETESFRSRLDGTAQTLKELNLPGGGVLDKIAGTMYQKRGEKGDTEYGLLYSSGKKSSINGNKKVLAPDGQFLDGNYIGVGFRKKF